MFSISDLVYDTSKNQKVQIIERYEVWGFVSYKVLNTLDDTIYKATEQQLCADIPAQAYDVNYLRYITLLAKIKNETATGMLSSLSSGVIPLPHQLHVLNRVLSTNNIRYILADEVGLGKTIEAGLIIKELKARGLIKRILVVCPKGLVTQWALELHEKFNEKFHVILPNDYDTIRKLTDSDDVYGQFEQVISPMDSIKPLERRAGWTDEKIAKYNDERIYSIINSGWDLVVIDEAHRVAGSSGEVARYKLGEQLAGASPYLLLLTATPHNGKTEPFLRLIRLIDEKAFPNFKAIVKEQVSPYLIRTEKREAIDNNGNRLFKNRITKAVDLTWDKRHTMQRELYKMTSDYVAKGYNKAMRNKGKNMWFIFLLIMMQRLVTSSTSAILNSLERRIKVLEAQDFKLNSTSEGEYAEFETEENMEDAILAFSFDIKEEIALLSEIVAVAKQAEFQYLDVKIEPFLDIIDKLSCEEKECKIIVFTEFVATQSYLSKLLLSRDYTTSLLNGSMSIEERNQVLDEFKNKTNILISTDAGGEGLNLQFSHIVINYDLPWNPMKIEQRIGRVDRIGQQRDVLIYNFMLTDTVEMRVRDVLEKKLAVILDEIGIDKYSDVLDNEAAELNFTEAFMQSIRNPKDIEHNLKPVEEDLKQQIKNANIFKDIIKEDKDLSVITYTNTNFNIEVALRELVTYYANWRDEPFLPTKNYSINDVEITKHLNANIVFAHKQSVLSIDILNFPNEKGYFILWELSISDTQNSKQIIPVFINHDFILRPLAGKKILDEIINPSSQINTRQIPCINNDVQDKLNEISMQFAYDLFMDMKTKYEQRNEETYKKYIYALNLRIDAAKNIGIENIKKHRLINLYKEKAIVEYDYKKGKQIYPEFKAIFIVVME
jgi:superfamily II DNA or RNA helicase